MAPSNDSGRARSAFALTLICAAFLIGSVQPVVAAGVVGTGTPDSCTEAALDAALDGGGNATFNCGASPVTITVTSTKTIGADTIIDGGSLITISGGNAVRVFLVRTAVYFTVQNLTIANGKFNAGAGGSAIFNNAGTVAVTNSTLSGNSTSMEDGGAFYNLGGTVTVTNSTFSGNSASNGGGGAIINNPGTLKVTNTTFSGNTTSNGGGGAIFNLGDATVTNSTFSGNSASNGGGIDNSSGTLKVTNSTFFGNSAGVGGGIDDFSGTVAVTNSTLSGNSASSKGGGIDNFSGTVTVTNTLVAAIFERLVERAGARVCTADGMAAGDGPEALLMRRIADVFAEYERLTIQARTKAALAVKRSRRERISREPPYGWRLSTDGQHIEPEPREQAIVALARRLRRSGMSLRRIANRLARRGYTPRSAKRWHPQTISSITTSSQDRSQRSAG